MSKRAERPHRRRDTKRSKATGTTRGPSPSQATSSAKLSLTPSGGRAADRIARALDTADLTRVVPRLAPDAIHHLIRQRGLESCGALIAATTPQQLATVVDMDLWRTTTGRDDQFDAARFGTWVETLIEEGDAVAVRVMANMDPDLAIAGLSRYVRVFDPGVFQPTAQSDDDPGDFEFAPSTLVECEIGGYVVRARTNDTWDAIVGLLSALSTDRPDTFQALMEGCRRLSNSTPESDGLDELMLEPEQHLHDVAVEREHRRTDLGYLSAADARAFLQVARRPRSVDADGAPPVNAIAAAYFRALDAAEESTGDRVSSNNLAQELSSDASVSETHDPLIDVLVDAGVTPHRPRALLGPASADISAVTPIEPLMEFARDRDHAAYFARNRELAFLANALLAGCSVYSRAMTVEEAWAAAVGVCNVGLEICDRRATHLAKSNLDLTTLPRTFLVDHDLVTVFEGGWELLHREVSVLVIDRLIATLHNLHIVDSESQHDLFRLRRELKRARAAGTPWSAGEALEAVAILDTPTWACLCGLLSACPVVPSALGAIVDRRAASVSATEFECFTTTDQIRKVHVFAERLGEMLFG